MDKALLTVLAIRWTLANNLSSRNNQNISYSGVVNTFNDSDFETHAKVALKSSSMSIFKKKVPTQQDVDEILQLLKVKVSQINAWPEMLAAYHQLQSAHAIGDEIIFHDSFIDNADDVLLERIGELFE